MTKKELISKLQGMGDDATVYVPVDVGNGEWAQCPVTDVTVSFDGVALNVDFTEAT